MKTIQETTSTYFNSIIRRVVSAINVEELPVEAVDNFNRQMLLAFTDDAEISIRRVRYLIQYSSIN